VAAERRRIIKLILGMEVDVNQLAGGQMRLTGRSAANPINGGRMRKIAISSLCLLASVTSTRASAESRPASTESGMISDAIIVTATKRQDLLQNVPVSISVTNQAVVQLAEIRDLINLQSIVPSLKVMQFNASAQTNFVIRGFGNGNGNYGVESSVGVFVDGVYRSRSLSALDDLPEIERIEVLRGPQSTLFGKNVSAGAINIVTVKPQFAFGGKAEVSVGNYGAMVVKATITGPLTDTVALRLSGSANTRRGYLQNIVTGAPLNDRNRASIRADVLWQPSPEFSLRVIGDFNRINERCCGVVTILNGPATRFIGAPPPTGLGRTVGDPTRPFDGFSALTSEPHSFLTGKGVSAEIDYDFGFAELTSITAYRDQRSETREDIDYTGANIANRTDEVGTKAFTQEVRLASSGKGGLSWLVGGFYQHEKLKLDQSIAYGDATLAFVDGLAGGAISTLELLQSLVTPSIVRGKTYFQAGQGVVIPLTLDQTSFSIFGQADYKITSRLTITGGAAYLHDRKAATQAIVMTDSFSALDLHNIPQLPLLGVPANAFQMLSALQFFYGDTPNHGPINFPNDHESGRLKGKKITYAGRIAYDLDPVRLYLGYTTGWKAGAYNLSSDSRPPDAAGRGRTADPENVSVYEAGLKAEFQGGYLNLAIFDQTIRNFQSNVFTGTTFSLVNAGKQSVRGVEVDTAYRPLKWLTLTGAVTYLRPRYDSFTHAPCVNYDTLQCAIDPVTSLRPAFRDLSGTTPSGISRWNMSVSAVVTHEFNATLHVYLRGEYDYASKAQLSDTAPPDLASYGTNNVNGSLGFVSAIQQIDLMLWARNLLDDRQLTGAFPTLAQDGSYSGYPNQPRTYGVTLRKAF
jgi:iron complex outermembrane receptor protein